VLGPGVLTLAMSGSRVLPAGGKKLIDAMGGTVTVESALGSGSRFMVLLPGAA